MTEAQAVVSQVKAIEVKRKKSKFTGMLGRIIAFTFGGIGVLMSLVLMVTIIGIIPGFFMLLGSTGFIMASLGYQDVKCPSCDKKQTVLKNAEDFKCKRCNQPTIIHWT